MTTATFGFYSHIQLSNVFLLGIISSESDEVNDDDKGYIEYKFSF